MKLPRPVRAVVFDMDGLLVDSEVTFRDAIIAISPRFGEKLTVDFVHSMIGTSYHETNKRLRTHYGDDLDIDAFRIALGGEMAARMPVALKAGVVELLDLLDALKLPRAVCTSSPHAAVDRQLGPHGLIARFDAIVARGDYEQFKPHPDPYLTAARKLGVAPEDCLALEDSHLGVQAAHAAGMMTVMVPDLLTPNDDSRARVIAVAETLHEVRAMLRSD